MAEGMCAKCSRYLLIIFNFIFWVSGGVLLGVGLYLRIHQDTEEIVRQFVTIDVPLEVLYTGAYVLIGVGAFVFVIGFCGCCGAVRESSCMLGTYIFCMVLIMCAELAAGIYVAVERGKLEQLLHDKISSAVQNYTVGQNRSTLDSIQIKLSCCGTDNFTDFSSNTFFIAEGQKLNMMVPDSCCVQSKINTIVADPIDKLMCQEEARQQITNGTYLHSEGCYNKVEDWLEVNSLKIIGVVVGIALLEILGVIFAVCLCRNRTDYYDDD